MMKPTSGLALDHAEFQNLITPFRLHGSVALAVSGGLDSLCLAYLMKQYADLHDIKVYAFTVDHKLRAESAMEAAWVHDWMEKLDMTHEILVWEHDEKITTKIQERARHHRYRLLWQACGRYGIFDLITAHHLDDQLETFWMRLNHGSGIRGLCGMKPIVMHQNGRLLRPFLTIPKDRLKTTLQANKLLWINDPSNNADQFERVRVRSHFQEMKQENCLDLTKIQMSFQKLQEIEDFIEQEATAFLKLHPMFDDKGWPLLEFLKYPNFLKIRIVMLYLNEKIPRYYKADEKGVRRLLDRLQSPQFKRTTFGGLIFEKKQSDQLVIRYEHPSF